MPIAIIVIASIAFAALEIGARGRRDRSSIGAIVRLYCIATHSGREAGVAHICRCGMTEAVRGDHGPAAEVPIKMLSEHTGDAV